MGRDMLQEYAPGSAEMPAASTLALLDAAMAAKPDREGLLLSRIRELENTLRCWRDDYKRDPFGMLVTIPVHQIVALIGEK